MRAIEALLVQLEHLPLAGRLLAWLVWISVASLPTTVVGLALVGLGFFAHPDGETGTFKVLGVEITGGVRHLMIGGGILIYLLGGGLLAPSLPQQPTIQNNLMLGSFGSL
ncbi:MAG TPA: hypothetical protein VGW40_10510 [Allosphingosinicella sp.]|nr:hypothetical protein [Allosphingosinicella sp.]